MEKSPSRKGQPRPEPLETPACSVNASNCKPAILDNNNATPETKPTGVTAKRDEETLAPLPTEPETSSATERQGEDLKQVDKDGCAEGGGCSSWTKDGPGKDCEFVEGLDVLARWNDGLFYLGTVSKVIPHQKKCLVIFEDSSEHWVLFKHLQKGRTPNSEITCSVCEGDQSDPPNEIVICDRCGLGYHQLCHQPVIDSRKLLCPDESWHCRQCVFVNSAKVGGALKKGPAAKVFQEMKQSLPYTLNNLQWDAAHRTNTEHCYCYCGGPGEWYLKMLRCCRCMQWFHEACIQCLEMPMLYGDGFFIFVCSVCNSGPEYLKRLPLKWQDLTQLILYNLTLMHRKKYYDFEEEIIPYLTEQWYNLQVSHLGATTRSEKQERLLEALQSSKVRFACGKEVKKKQNIWGLRIRKPPIPPTIILPAIGQITDEVMNDLKMTGRKVVTFVPVERSGTSLSQLAAEHILEAQQHQRLKALFRSNSPVPLKPAKRKRKNVAETPEELERRSLNARKMFDQAVKDGVNRPSFSCNQSYTGYTGEGIALSELTPVSEGQSVLDTIRPFETVYADSTGVPIPISFSQHSSSSGDTNSDYSATTIPAGSSSGDGGSGDGGIKRHQKHGSWKRKRKLVGATQSPTKATTKTANTSKSEDLGSPSTRLNGAVSMSEIKRTMSSHYGAEGRLACGENYQLLGKRITPDGKIQYLIQWEGVTP